MRLHLTRPAAALCAMLSVSAAAFSPATAMAQGDAMTEMARQRFQEGVKFYDQKQYEQARAAFLQAWALKHHPAVLLNLAQSELRSGHEADAANHFAQYLRDNTNATALERREAEKGLSAAKAQVGEVTVNAENGAEVFVGDNPLGRSPLPGSVFVRPGAHTIHAKLGGDTKSATINVAAGQATTANLLAAGTPPPVAAVPDGASPPPEGTAPVPTEPGQPPPPPQEDHGTETFSTSDSRYEPVPKWFVRQKLAWVGAGVTGLGVVGGIAFSLSSKSDFDRANDIKAQITDKFAERGLRGAPCNPPPDTDFQAACRKFLDAEDSAESARTASVVSFVIAGVAAAGTVVYYFVDRKKTDAGATAVIPVVTPEGGTLSVIGAF